MHKFEQLVFGAVATGDGVARSVIGASPGIRSEVRDEIVRLCEGWGTPPALGMENPALMSMPLKTTTAAMSGRLWAVIRIGRGLSPLFHAVVLTDNSYTAFLRNPFTLARGIDWIDEWKPGHRLESGEVAADHSLPLVTPPAGSGDLGLVDEALLKYMIEGKLDLPIERPNADSDRCLSLIIACLPENDRKDLRFASFAPHDGNHYGVAATGTENCHFAGWQRMMSAWLAGDFCDEVEQYVVAIREYLPKGDMAGVTRVTMRVSPKPGRGRGAQETSAAPAPVLDVQRHVEPETVRHTTPPTAAPAAAGPAATTPQAAQESDSKPLQKPVAEPTPAATPAAKTGPGSRKPLAATGPVGSGSPPAPRTSPVGPAGASGPGLPAGPTPPLGATGKIATTNISTNKSTRRKRSTRAALRRRPRLPLLRVGALTLVLAAAVFTGMNWLDGKTLSESLEWAKIPGWMTDQIRTERAPTLLEVVDVGMVYEKQLGLVTGKSGLGFQPSEDQGRRRAMGNLREHAAMPLEAQVKLFGKLAADGIQQGTRPDREIQRMGSLAAQGEVIRNEIDRLELAYYSLASATYWEDLHKLDDDEVAARRDSLIGADPEALDHACEALWVSDPRPVLADALTSVGGMSDLMDLFHADRWSQGWETRVATAAENVSPTASTMTRAYRNSAFTFLRIKKAERQSAHRNLPYRNEFRNGAWPSPAVAAALPALRAQVRNFDADHVPPILEGVLDLYVQLKAPADLATEARTSGGVLKELEGNPAFAFHPEAYQPFTARIRYEAALDDMGDPRDPARVPVHLSSRETAVAMAAFADTLGVVRDPAVWNALAADLDDSFLADWAAYHGRRSGARLAKAQVSFDRDWTATVESAKALQAKAAKGEDWTAEWRDLDNRTRAILSDHARALSVDPERSGRLAMVANVSTALHQPLEFEVQAVTVRLDQDRLTNPSDVRVEMKILPDGPTLESGPVPIGPAAPEGSGWVGTASVAWRTKLEPGQSLAIRVLGMDDGKVHLETTCPALEDDGGVGGLSRPLAGDGGSVGLRSDAAYWSSLKVPALELVF